MKITLLTGKAGVGKDTYAKKISGEHSNVYAFADFLKVVATSLGWDGEKDDKGRRLLQHLGDVAREYDLDVFVNYIVMLIADDFMYADIKHAIITDCRYDNEVTKIRSAFKKDAVDIELIELTRDFDTSLNEDALKHPSEQGISDDVKAQVNFREVNLNGEVS